MSLLDIFNLDLQNELAQTRLQNLLFVIILSTLSSYFVLLLSIAFVVSPDGFVVNAVKTFTT